MNGTTALATPNIIDTQQELLTTSSVVTESLQKDTNETEPVRVMNTATTEEPIDSRPINSDIGQPSNNNDISNIEPAVEKANVESLTSITTTTTDIPNATQSSTTTTTAAAATETTITNANTSTPTNTAPVQPPPSHNNNNNSNSYKYDPEKITLRFLFANRDGLTVTLHCNPSDTIGEVKGALISIWPKDVPQCDDGDDLRLICMGKGYLSPDSRTLLDCQIPTFKTHPTPVNVSVKPGTKIDILPDGSINLNKKKQNLSTNNNSSTNTAGTVHNTNNHATTVNNNNNHRAGTSSTSNNSNGLPGNAIETGQGCGCIIS